MTDARWQDIWMEQCEAAEGIMKRFGTEAAFDYIVGEKLVSFAQAAAERPEFAQALPGFISRLREMFTPEELCGNLDRIERLWLEMGRGREDGRPALHRGPGDRFRTLEAARRAQGPADRPRSRDVVNLAFPAPDRSRRRG